MLRILRTSTLALAGALLMLGSCGSPTKPTSSPNVKDQAVWVRVSSGTGQDPSLEGMAADPSGNLYGIGSLYDTGTLFFGDVSATGAGEASNGFVVKFNTAGTALWARSARVVPSEVWFTGVATDGSGNVYVAGTISGNGTYDFGTETDPVTVTGAADARNAVLIKYSASGEAQWVRSTTVADSNSDFFAVAADASGNVYAAGRITERGEFDFGLGETVTGLADNDAVLVKYDTDGDVQWVRTPTTAPSDSLYYAAAVDGAGHVYVAGSLRNTGAFGFGASVTATPSAGGQNAALVKFDASGTPLWARTVVSGTGDSWFNGLVADANQVFAVGTLWATDVHSFGNGVTAAGSNEFDCALVLRYDAEGTPAWARAASGPSFSQFKAAVLDGSGGVTVAGYVNKADVYTFGSVMVNGTGSNNNAVLLRYDAEGSAVWARSTVSGSPGSSFFGLAKDGDGHLYAAGYVGDSGSYDFGNHVTTGEGSGDSRAILVRYE